MLPLRRICCVPQNHWAPRSNHLARAATKKAAVPQTTGQQLGSLIKSARDIMRKDKGLNGDIDRLPMLTWVMFLKFLDDLEHIHEQEAALAGKLVQPSRPRTAGGIGRRRKTELRRS